VRQSSRGGGGKGSFYEEEEKVKEEIESMDGFKLVRRV